MRKQLVSLLFFALLCCAWQPNKLQAQVDSFKLYYDIGVYELTASQEKLLRSRLNQLDTSFKYRIQVKGSADYLGTPESNQVLSENRAKAVFNFIDAYFDTLIIKNEYLGLGEIPIKGDSTQLIGGVQEDRKVTVYLKYQQEEIKTKLGTLKLEENLVLEDLNFQPGRHILLKESVPNLFELLQIMEENPDLKIEIEGHICCHSDPNKPDAFDIDTKDYKLSENRAKNIYKFLIRKGIDPKRLSYKGYGFQRPLFYPERTSLHQKKNRRVEIKVVDL